MKPLRIGIIVDDPDDLSIGDLRLLEGICADERFQPVKIFTAKNNSGEGGGIFEYFLRCEAALFARKRAFNAPAYEARKGEIAVFSLSGNEVPGDDRDFDVLVDLTRDGGHAGAWRLSSYDRAAGFWEACNNAAVTMVSLYRLGRNGKHDETIAQAAYNTKFVASRNAAFIKEKSVQLVLRELARYHMTGKVISSSAAISTPERPGPVSLIAYGFKLFIALTRRSIFALMAKVRLRPGMFVLKICEGDFFNFDPSSGTLITPEGNSYWADPFLFRHESEDYIFFENYDYSTNKGHISAGKLNGGKFEYLGDVLKSEGHLSYPFLFSADDEIFMIPETVSQRRIELWRCRKFPLDWELHGSALEGVATVDTVLAEHEGRYWLFTNVSKDSYGDHCSELHIYAASSPELSDLTPHPFNPVVIDSRTARGGGRVFSKDGRLFRIGQNNSHGEYGYGLNIMEITRLDMSGYEEKIVRSIDPDFDASLMGVHHLDAANGVVVIDVRKKLGGFAG